MDKPESSTTPARRTILAATAGAVATPLTATVDLSKDNVQFGVRAVDRQGHQSTAAAPAPTN